jgi:hypothetical protein
MTPIVHNHHTPPSVSVIHISHIFPNLSFNFATKVVEALFGSENVLDGLLGLQRFYCEIFLRTGFVT